MDQMPEIVTLGSLDNGAAEEAFKAGLAQILENISDPNTKPETTRAITLTVKLKPAPDRNKAAVTYEVTTKLAPQMPCDTMFFFGVSQDGEMVAREYNPQQTTIQEHINAQTGGEKISPIRKAGE